MLTKDPLERPSLPELLEYDVVQARMQAFVEEAQIGVPPPANRAQHATKRSPIRPPAERQQDPRQARRAPLGNNAADAAAAPATGPERPQTSPAAARAQVRQPSHERPVRPATAHGPRARAAAPRMRRRATSGELPSQGLALPGTAAGAPPPHNPVAVVRSEAPCSGGVGGSSGEADLGLPHAMTPLERLAEIERRQRALQEQMSQLQQAKRTMELGISNGTVSSSQEAEARNPSQRPPLPPETSAGPFQYSQPSKRRQPPSLQPRSSQDPSPTSQVSISIPPPRPLPPPAAPPPAPQPPQPAPQSFPPHALHLASSQSTSPPLPTALRKPSRLRPTGDALPSPTPLASPVAEPVSRSLDEWNACFRGGVRKPPNVPSGLCGGACGGGGDPSPSLREASLASVEEYEDDFESDETEVEVQEDLAATEAIKEDSLCAPPRREPSLPSSRRASSEPGDVVTEDEEEAAQLGSGCFGSFAVGRSLRELEATVRQLRIEVAEKESAREELQAFSSTIKEVASRLSPVPLRRGSQALRSQSSVLLSPRHQAALEVGD